MRDGVDEKGAGTTVPSRGRGNFQQKIIRDRISPHPQNMKTKNIVSSLVIAIILVAIYVLFLHYQNPKISGENRTCEFNSSILGFFFSYPCDWGNSSEIVYPAVPHSDKMPYEYWRFKTEPENISFYLLANNKKTATYTYEGGNLLEYYGQPLDDLCSNRSFLDQTSFKVEKIECEKFTNNYGLEYIKFEVELSSLYEYGYNYNDETVPKFVRSFFFEKVMAQQIGDIFKISGILFPSKSEKWPGISMYTFIYYYQGDKESRSNYAKGKEEIEKIIPTLRYSSDVQEHSSQTNTK